MIMLFLYYLLYFWLKEFELEVHLFVNHLWQFIFDAATRFCVEIATQRHGCCVLQKCIAHASGRHRDKLVTEVSRNGLLLSQDPYG